MGTQNPYVSTSSAANSSGKSPMDVLSECLSTWSQKFDDVARKAEAATGNIWQHFTTGPNMVDTACGRLSQASKVLIEGGPDKVYRQTFETLPNEQLRKSYACYISTSSGPVAGTLYISTKKIAFCSDRPLSCQPAGGQAAWSYYKVVVPLNMLRTVNASSNINNPTQRYIQVQTVDEYEFWFMGFISYDKALRSLQEAHLYNVEDM